MTPVQDFLNQMTRSQQVLVIISVLILLYLLYKNYYTPPPNPAQEEEAIEASKANNNLTQWINKGYGFGYGEMSPASRLPDLIKEFGEPTIIDPKSGGMAAWYGEEALQGTPYQRIEIRDEQIPHDKPAKHTDFLYSWHKQHVPNYKISGLHKISGSISYDPLKKLVRARCHDMRPNVVTHWVVKKYAEDELSIDEAVGLYGPMIMELFQDDPHGTKYRQLESEL